MMRAQRGSMERKSEASARFASSAMAPAISTPVGAAADDHEIQEATPLVGIGSVSARSKASRMRRRK